VPTEYKGNPDKFVDIMVEEMLPAVKEQGIAKYCDVFCEEGVFTVDQSRRILEKARELGFLLRIHADEVHDTGGAGLAAELGTVSAEHLLAANEKNLRSMAVNGVIADVLPATAYSLKKPYAPVRKMIDLGVPVALATDCNPGSCFTESIPFVFGLGVMNMDMTVEEALVATTLNPAWSLGLQDRVGSLEVGKQADFLLLDGESPAILAYHAGVSPVVEVYKKGVQVA
jgi:imidazolonepropionase